MPVFQILVLAASRKRNGLCVAGYRLDGERDWVRPVSDDEAGTLYEEHYTVDGRAPEIFDVVEIEVDEHRPDPWQAENWHLSSLAWKLSHRANPGDIKPELLSQVDHDSRVMADSGRTVPASVYENSPLDRSLILVRPDELRWNIETPPWGGKQRKALFTLDGKGPYDFIVTDPAIEETLAQLPDGVHERSAVGIDDDEEVLLVISLTEPFPARADGSLTCSKLVAAVVRLPG